MSGTRILVPGARFGRTPLGLLTNPDVSDAECRAYAWLTSWDFRRTGRVFTGREEMAGDVGWSVSKLDSALRALERRGAIRRIRKGPGRTNDIELLAEEWDDDRRVAGSDDQESHDAASQESHDAATSRENAQERTQETSSGPAGPSSIEQGTLVDIPRRPRARNPIFDALAEVFPAETESEKKFIGKISGELARAGASAEQVLTRARAALREWPRCSPQAVSKNWSLLADIAARDGPVSADGDEYDETAAAGAAMDRARRART